MAALSLNKKMEFLAIKYAREGQLAMLQKMDFDKYKINILTIGDEICLNGHLNIMKWFHKKYPNFYPMNLLPNHVKCAVNHPHILDWYHSIGCDIFNYLTCCHVIRHSKEPLNMLKWLILERNCPLSPILYAVAVEKKRYDIIEWLQSVGCPTDEEACSAAASYGDLNILKWLRSHNFPWNKDTTDVASFMKEYLIYKWAVKNGCPRNVENDNENFRDYDDIELNYKSNHISSL